jgi:cation:H+ antiporter
MILILIIILFIILGFIALYFGSKLVIISLENIANHLGISHLMVGLTILAIGTSLPEIAVSVAGGFDKLTGINPNVDGIVIGNMIGSFFTQITLILGILGLSQKIFVSKWELRREGVMLFVSVFIFLSCALDGVICRIDAIILMISYIVYLILIIWSEKKIQRAEPEIKYSEKERFHKEDFKTIKTVAKPYSIRKDIVFFMVGLLIILIGAEITVLSAHAIAIQLDVPPSVVGIFIVGFGTSLPELCADLTALRRESEGIAIGDILGSNICDILFATGSGAIIAEFNVDPVLIYFDIPMLFIAISLAFYFLWTEKTLKRWEAAFLIGFYGFYAILKLSFFQF